jgi:hypothetical protein
VLRAEQIRAEIKVDEWINEERGKVSKREARDADSDADAYALIHRKIQSETDGDRCK